MSEILLLRHGQASFGTDSFDRLSELGLKQATIVGQFFLESDTSFTKIYSGTLKRQINTAQQIIRVFSEAGVPQPPVETTDQLNEYDIEPILDAHGRMMAKVTPGFSGHWRTLVNSPRAFKDFFESALSSWISGKFSSEDFESWDAFVKRSKVCLRQIMQDNGSGQRILVVTSGGPICAMTQLALGFSDEVGVQINWQLYNTSITSLLYQGDRLTVRQLNAIPHLQRQGLRSLISYR